MAASRVGRQAREVLTADLGERGRRTGQAMPRLGDIPLTQEGFEDPDAYFKSPPTQLYLSRTGQNAQPNSKKRPSPSSSAYVSTSQQPPSSANRRQRRPDVTVDIGLKGRKTGAPIVTGRRMPIASNGLEDIDAFFAAKPASVPALKAKSRKRISNLDAETEFDDGQDVTRKYGRREPSDDDDDDDDDEAREQYSDPQDESRVDEENDDAEDSHLQRADSYADDDSKADPGGSRLNDIDEEDEDAAYEGANGTTTRTLDVGQLSDASGTDNGTKSMSLDGSSYFNKSGRTLGSLASKNSLQRVRADTSLVGLSPSITIRNQNSSPRRLQATGQRRRAGSDPSTSSENDAIQNSLTKSYTSASQIRKATYGVSPSTASKGKGKARQDLYDETQDDVAGDDQGSPPRVSDHDNYEYDTFGGGDDYPDGDGETAELGNGAEPGYGDDSDDNEPAPAYPEDDEVDDQFEEEEAAPASPIPKSTKRKRKDVFDEDTDNNAGHDSGHAERPKMTTYQKKKKRVAENPRGLRRSERDRTHPLEFWRNEHVVYRRRDSGINVYYEKIGVEERPRQPIKSLVKKAKTARTAKPKKQNADADKGERPARSASTESSVDEQQQHNWAQWDQETEPDGIVWDYVEGKEMQKRVAFTSAMLDPKTTKHHAYKFQRVFTDGDFMAGGILVIPPNESKPLKPARDNSYILFCHQGAVRVLVHRTEFTIAMGGFFFIPRGNSYQISNLTDIDAVLCFFQSREIIVDSGETDEVEDEEGAEA